MRRLTSRHLAEEIHHALHFPSNQRQIALRFLQLRLHEQKIRTNFQNGIAPWKSGTAFITS